MSQIEGLIYLIEKTINKLKIKLKTTRRIATISRKSNTSIYI